MPADLPDSPAPLAEISQGPSAFELFLDRNQKNIVIFAILIAIGAAAYVIYSGVEKSRQITAGEAFNKAEDLAALQSVVTEHADTAAGHSALVLLADKQWDEGQQDAAIATLRKFVAENATHPALPSAKASLGAKLMTQGKSGDAAQVFQELVDEPNARYIAPFALISLGDIAKTGGDTTKAEEYYNRAKKDFAESSFVETATKRIAVLKAKAPVEIAAPPKPANEKPADPTAALKASLPPGVTITEAPAPSAPPSSQDPPPVETPAPAPAPAETPAPSKP